MNKVEIMFELINKLHTFKEGDEPKPFVITQEYTLSMGEKANLRKIIEGVLGKSFTNDEANHFDVESLLGQACLINIKHKVSKAGNERAEIASASPLMEGQDAKEPFNVPKLLTFQKWDEEFFDSLPDFIKEKITSSAEYEWMKRQVLVPGTDIVYPTPESEGLDLNNAPF